MTKAAELAAALRRAIQTANNDDWSSTGTAERRRHDERQGTMRNAAEYLEGLAAYLAEKPGRDHIQPEGVAK